MTKQWDVYEATIKDLYAENTLAVVRQIMIDQYGFRASVRAYRGRLFRWGVRKYNCRKRGTGGGDDGRCASPSASHSSGNSSYSSGSDPVSPGITNMTMNGSGGGTGRTLVPTRHRVVGTGHRLGGGDGYLAMPGQMGHQHQHQHHNQQGPQYGPVHSRGHQTQMYNANVSYNTKPKVLLSPPMTHHSSCDSSSNSNDSMQYTWDTSTTATATHPPSHKRLSDAAAVDNGFATADCGGNPHQHQQHHGGVVMAPPTYFGAYSTPATTTPMTSISYNSPMNVCYDETNASHRDSSSGLPSYYDTSQRGQDLSYAPTARDYVVKSEM